MKLLGVCSRRKECGLGGGFGNIFVYKDIYLWREKRFIYEGGWKGELEM